MACGCVFTMARTLGWFDAIKAWIAVSDFMRGRNSSRRECQFTGDIFTLRHFWKASLPLPASPRDDGYYVFMGRLVEMKGVKVLLDAWDLILRERGIGGPKLKIAGDGELAPAVIARAATNPLVSYCGRVDGEEKRTLLQGCGAMIAPSLLPGVARLGDL